MMPVINGVIICDGTNPSKRRKGDPLPKKGDPLPKRLNPLAPEFIPKGLESTPPSSGETAFAVPAFTLVKQQHPPNLGPCPYQGPRQEPYQPQGLQGAYQGHHRQASSAFYQGGYVTYQQPPVATYGYEHHMSFSRNITREVMAALNDPSPPRRSMSQAPVYPTIAGWQTS